MKKPGNWPHAQSRLDNMENERKVLCTGGSGFIGFHFCAHLIEQNIPFLNVDIISPSVGQHKAFWSPCDILDDGKILNLFLDYKPTHVVHLAARASMDGESLDDFSENTIGTKNVLEAIQKTPGVEHVVIASTQHVRKPGSGFPQHDEDYNPHGLYGESKVITEQLTRAANLNCTWTVIRPTTVWGPRHPFLVDGLWRLMKKGLYIHPKGDPVVRSYGYVKNVVWQIDQILKAPVSLVDKKTLYVGETLIKQLDWINAFSKALNGRNALVLSKTLIHMLAWLGDLLGLIGISFPMQSERYFNLTTSNPVPTNVTTELFGEPPYTLDDGIKETVAWLEAYWNQS